jgi:hypothetical protein
MKSGSQAEACPTQMVTNCEGAHLYVAVQVIAWLFIPVEDFQEKNI